MLDKKQIVDRIKSLAQAVLSAETLQYLNKNYLADTPVVSRQMQEDLNEIIKLTERLQ